jgi:hypothetical protein
MIGPKFLVLAVAYAPPGSQSSVVYQHTTMLGSTASLSASFSNDTKLTSSLTAGGEVKIPGVDVSADTTVGSSLDIQEQLDASASLALQFTETTQNTVHGPNSSLGVNHDADLIYIWLNPVLIFDVYSDTDFTWKGFGYDLRDNAVNAAEIIGIPVAYLNGHAQIEDPYLLAALERSWAPPVVCVASDPDCVNGTKGPGLTANDFAEILKADPFTDSNYVVNVPTGARCSVDGRFCRTSNANLQYVPPPPNTNPSGQSYALSYQDTTTESLTGSVTVKIGFSQDFGASASAGGIKLAAKLSEEDTLTFSSKVTMQATQQDGHQSTISVTGPTYNDHYTGPVEMIVFRDEVYGTFMLNPVLISTFNLSVSPSALDVFQGSCSNYSVVIGALRSGFGGAINLSVSGLPANATGVFNPATINGAGSSTLTVCTAASTPLGATPIVVTGAYGSEVHSSSVTLNVKPAPDFSLAASPSSASIVASTSASFTVSTAPLNGFSDSIALSLSGLPSGVTAGFYPAPVAAGGSSTLTIQTNNLTPAGTYLLTITGSGGGKQHSIQITLTVTPLADFGIAVVPNSASVVAGNTITLTVATSSSGYQGPITFSMSGLPAGASASLNPASVNAGYQTALYITTSASTPLGIYNLSLNGSGGGVQHSTPLTLSVTAPPPPPPPICQKPPCKVIQ